MIRSSATLPIAVLLGAAIAALPVFASGAKAEEAAALAKSDRLPVHAVATDCAQKVWPHIDTSCLRSSEAGGRISEARLIVAPQSSPANHNR
ncbi:MAG: hypothetical protein QOF07_1782 [Bradyrhizobium sp.]|jgi:hypothetical protein|nr:hypothetical protein [Bradyrhizobium sp.]